MDGGDGADFLPCLVESNGRVDVDVADAVAVGEEESPRRPDILDFADAPGGQGVFAGVGEGDAPVFFVVAIVEVTCGSRAQRKRDVAAFQR